MQQSHVSSPSVLSGFEVSLLAVLLLVDSLHFVFARLLLPHVSPNVSAMYVMVIATVQVGIYGLVRRELHVGVVKSHLWFFIGIGALIAASTAMNYAAVAFIDVGTAAMLGKTTVVFSMGYGIFWLHERLAPRQIVGALIAIAGVFVITFQPADYLRVGSLLVVGSTFLYSTHTALVKRHGGVMDFMDFFFFRLLFTSIFLFLFAAGRGVLELPTRDAWLLLILVATVDIVLSRTLYYLALRRLKMSIHAIVLTLTPVAAILWSLLLFDTFPTSRQLLGGLAVLVGVMIMSWRRPR